MNSPFGLLAFLHWNHKWNNWHFPPQQVQRAIDQLKELGISMLRLDVVWSDIHRGDFQYDYKEYDRLLGQLTDAGFDLLVLLHYNKIREDAAGKEIWNRPPDSYSEFARYVETTVRRYRSRIRHWEIWNEPNHPYYWTAPADDLRSYCRLLRQSYIAAKTADPSCIVLNGGITEPILKSVNDLYLHGGKDIFDVLSIHTFLHPRMSNPIQAFDNTLLSLKNIMERYGDGKKKVWITEMGCPGVPQPRSAKNWWLGENLSETEQADWLETQYKMIKSFPFVEKLFWAFYRDTNGVFADGVDYLGIVRNDFSPKPAFERYKRLIRSGV